MAAIIPEALAADCHLLGSLPTGQLLLNRNATMPWFILLPESRLEDLLDLPAEHREAVLSDCAGVSAFIKQVLGFTKVNFAGLGNVVPDMHLHVIGRAEGDACWPLPVWGNLPEGPSYEAAQLLEWQQELQRMLNLQAAPLE